MRSGVCPARNCHSPPTNLSETIMKSVSCTPPKGAHNPHMGVVALLCLLLVVLLDRQLLVAEPLKAALDEEAALDALREICWSKGSRKISGLEPWLEGKDFLLEALKWCPSAIAHTTDAIRDDKEFITAAVQLDGTSLESASERLRADRDVVRVSGMLQYASDELRDDRELVVRTLVEEKGKQLMHASVRLRDDLDIVHAAVQHKPGWRSGATRHSMLGIPSATTGIVLQARRRCHDALPDNEPLRDDGELILTAVCKDGVMLGGGTRRWCRPRCSRTPTPCARPPTPCGVTRSSFCTSSTWVVPK
eukprot:Sspe_Gene.104726::Locus_81779_Transcript_1_1_Confidence_1.000_Length_1792::g.104726::m.104726